MVLEPGDERFHEISSEASDESGLKEDIDTFFTSEQKLKENGRFEAETRYIPAKSPHLISWYQTNEAMIMLLSNHIIQVSVIQPRTVSFILILIEFSDKLFEKSQKDPDLPTKWNDYNDPQ